MSFFDFIPAYIFIGFLWLLFTFPHQRDLREPWWCDVLAYLINFLFWPICVIVWLFSSSGTGAKIKERILL